MQKNGLVIEKLVNWFVYGMFFLTIFTVVIALFSNETEGEAEIGSFQAQNFNEGWTLEMNGNVEAITLPASIDAQKGDLVTIKNTLPSNLTNGSCLMVRASLEDIYIFINGELREQYATENTSTMSYYLPSAYIVTELSEQDSCTEVAVRVRVKAKGKLNEIQIGQGNNVWFNILQKHITVNAIAFVVLILGIILIATSSIMKRYMQNFHALFFLGLTMIDMAIWVFSESRLRQIIFSKPSLTGYFTYLSLGLMGALACLFFDEIQHRKYHSCYLAVESIACLQLAVNMILHFTHIAEFHQTLIFTHTWLFVGLVCVIVNVILDIYTKRIQHYSVIASGIVCFLVCALMELVVYYISIFRNIGTFVCIGLVILTIATVVQVMIDQIITFREREENQTKIVVNTIETIAMTIDAKDEYTGGHSERVGQYAAILARGMAADYDFSEEDILRIHYIGIMHDIGKIGVADTVLNKPGRLTDSEFSLMKKHVEIGFEMLTGMNESISGLADGIRYHHERFDGKGYPEGLSDTEIPLVARILCIVDCYDAMTSNRVYRKRLTDEEVRAEFVRCAGTQFDPALVEIFVKLLDSGEMHSYTVDGMATSEKGTVLKSAVLENRLQEMIKSQDTLVNHPEHVRMLCFIMKLKEIKKEHTDVYIIRLKDVEIPSDAENCSVVEKMIKSHMGVKDVSIECNDSMKIIALFDKTEEELERFEKDLNAHSAYVFFEHI